MDPVSLCVNTQTPLVQFKRTESATKKKAAPLKVPNLSEFEDGVDYDFSPGGVTRMVFPLVRRMIQEGTLSDAHWVSLDPEGPASLLAGGITLHSVHLTADRLKGYGVVKETLWGAAHRTVRDTPASQDVFWTDDFSEYAYYNRLTAETIGALDRKEDFDLFYIHDFQQLPIGHMLGTLKPKIYRWHIPFEASAIPDQWRELLTTYFDSYNVIIASARRYVEALKSFGYSGKVRKIYPYVDPREYSRPPKSERTAVRRKLALRDRDDVVLVVARMDPMKGQDRAIRALAGLAPRYPNLKLVLVGNGSFSSSRQGLGLSKGSRWQAELEGLARHLSVEDRVVFAGHVTQRELDALYETCKFTVLPSVEEGFGLVVVEGWLHSKAAVVSGKAGIAELIEAGRNGLLSDPDDPVRLGEAMRLLLDDGDLTHRLGREGYRTSKLCSLDAGVRAETEVITQLIDR